MERKRGKNFEASAFCKRTANHPVGIEKSKLKSLQTSKGLHLSPEILGRGRNNLPLPLSRKGLLKKDMLELAPTGQEMARTGSPRLTKMCLSRSLYHTHQSSRSNLMYGMPSLAPPLPHIPGCLSTITTSSPNILLPLPPPVPIH